MPYKDIDPELQPALDDLLRVFGSTSIDLSNIEAARKLRDDMARHRASTEQEVCGVESTQHVVSHKGRQASIWLHIPRRAQSRLRPAVLYIHGGGFVTGAAWHAENKLREWVRQYDCVVVSVAYRLAPEFPFPAALNDCFTALQWLFGSAYELVIDTTKVVLLGESAGAGLATGLALFARDQGDTHQIAAQILIYPMLDHRNTKLPGDQTPDAHVWSRANNRIGWRAYLANGVDQGMLAYAAPLQADDLSNLPATYICVGSSDLFYEENILYAESMKNAGIAVELDVFPDAYHAFYVLAPDARVSREFNVKLHRQLSAFLL